ncbi:glutathione S-transferase family protein [Brucella intermedia]|uniref:glutathione S-transferase family protein n=1 Tax=Brucella intermedia TaxID=94625 RepID=UPI00224B9173|nr:glutathione S-transferase family protein [Brucella intermedia]
MLVVWGRKSSSNVQALMWCIGELGLPFVRHDIGHIYGGLDTDAFYDLNPNRTVPVLQDGGDPPLWETGAILRFLANRYAGNGFWPADAVARADVDRWAEWSKLNVALAFTGPVFWQVVRTPEKERDPAAIKSALRALEQKLLIAERPLDLHSFLVSDEITLADIQFGHVLFRYYEIEIDRAPLPNLKAYYERLAKRPAFCEHVMIPYDDLRA